MNIVKDTAAKRMLEAIAETNRLFREGAVAIGRLQNVAKAISSCEVFKYKAESTLEAYLDAELKDGNGISWLLDVAWSETEWIIRRKLVRSTNSGQDTIKEMPTKTIERFEEFVESLPRMAVELMALRTPELDQ